MGTESTARAGEDTRPSRRQGAPRRRPARIAFTALWLVVWGGAMLIALVVLARSLLAGEYAPVPILVLWLGGAGFGLYRVGLSFAETLGGERLGPEPERPVREWDDGMPRENDGMPRGDDGMPRGNHSRPGRNGR